MSVLSRPTLAVSSASTRLALSARTRATLRPCPASVRLVLPGGGRLGFPGRLPEPAGRPSAVKPSRKAVVKDRPCSYGTLLGEAEGRLGLVAEAEEQGLGPLDVGGEAEDVRTGRRRRPPGRSTRRSRCGRPPRGPGSPSAGRRRRASPRCGRRSPGAPRPRPAWPGRWSTSAAGRGPWPRRPRPPPRCPGRPATRPWPATPGSCGRSRLGSPWAGDGSAPDRGDGVILVVSCGRKGG